MARQQITSGTWTSILTTTVDTLISAEGGGIRIQTGSTTGVPVWDGFELGNGDAMVIPPGMTVSATPTGNSAYVQTINYGVAV